MNGIVNVEITEDELKLINSFTKKEMKKEDIFTFTVILCDNEIDRDFERFDNDSLTELSKLFVGKTGIFDHSMKSGDQVARIYATEVFTDENKRNSLNEKYTCVKAKCYMPRTEKNRDLIEEIEAGIKKEVSVSCSVSEVICSVCKTDLRQGYCEHIKGKIYGGEVCHSILKHPNDAYEWSFVAVPAQKGAGVTKSYKIKEVETVENIRKMLETNSGEVTLSAAQIQKLNGYIEALEKKSQDGEFYRNELTRSAIKNAAIAFPQMKSEMVKKVCGGLSVEELCEFGKVFEKQASEILPVKPQLSSNENYTSINNNMYKM